MKKIILSVTMLIFSSYVAYSQSGLYESDDYDWTPISTLSNYHSEQYSTRIAHITPTYQNEGQYVWIPNGVDPFFNLDKDKKIRFLNQFWNSDSLYNVFFANTKLKGYHYEIQEFKKGEKWKLTKINKLYNNSAKCIAYDKTKIYQKKNKVKPKDAIYVSYNKYDMVQERSSYKNGNKLRFRTKNNYDSSGLIIQSISYRGRKIKYTGRTTYEWYSKGKPKLITYYGCKEYKPHVVSFDCLPEGKNENTRKDTTTICMNTEVDANGNRLEIDTRRDVKGREYKTISRYNKENWLIAYESYDPNGKYSFGWEYTYNKQGRRIKYLYYNEKKELKKGWEQLFNDSGYEISYATIRKGQFVKRNEYAYNDSNQLIKNVQDKKNGKLKNTRTSVYQGKNEVEGTYIRKNGKKRGQYSRWIQEFDAKNNCVKLISYTIDNEIRGLMTYEYNNNNKLVKEVSFDKENKQLNATTYEYDSDGRKLKIVELDKNNRVKKAYAYSYDSEGRRTQVATFGKDYKPINATIYKFNEKGMLEKIEKYGKENVLKSVATYSFEYFK